ncbi:hypothetical protein K0M31_018850 [Melipona bicolor]|uniref:Uncharacterized protein n=1 Tax=Melipona bicolor TaxID=60889 RepID=A0AA40G466_9HYME|nr:hypothetical protein K0M31_018850 [Melipona bicolor]
MKEASGLGKGESADQCGRGAEQSQQSQYHETRGERGVQRVEPKVLRVQTSRDRGKRRHAGFFRPRDIIDRALPSHGVSRHRPEPAVTLHPSP